MKKTTTLIVALLVALCSCGPSKKEIMLEKQKVQIYSDVPLSIHASECRIALDDALEELTEMAVNYVQNQTDKAYHAFLDDRYGIWSSMYDNLDDFAYYLGGKTQEEEFQDKIDAYIEDSDEIFGGFAKYALDNFDSLFYEVDRERLRAEEFDFLRLGSGDVSDLIEEIIPPFGSHPQDYYDEEIANELVKAIILTTDKPVITACTYNDKQGVWTVRFESHSTRQVRFYLADNGEYNMEFAD